MVSTHRALDTREWYQDIFVNVRDHSKNHQFQTHKGLTGVSFPERRRICRILVLSLKFSVISFDFQFYFCVQLLVFICSQKIVPSLVERFGNFFFLSINFLKFEKFMKFKFTKIRVSSFSPNTENFYLKS